jgi:GDP-L-fucose synthase
MEKSNRIYVAGHNGMVGSSLTLRLVGEGYTHIFGVDHSKYDLTNPIAVGRIFTDVKPEYVFLAAAKVGGIHANNTYPAEFIYQNLQIQNNIIEACRIFEVKKLVFLASVCIYPKYAEVPVKEESLLTGELEPTNQWYAIAKIAGIKMCQAYRRQYGCDFISVMPCNLYGERDNFHPENSHVIPALIRKFIEAKENNAPSVVCWGTGEARREFMYADDMTDALVFLMNNYSSEEIINIGYGIDYTIKETAEMLKKVVGYEGEIVWDTTKPNGTPKRLLDTTKLFNMGWRPKIGLEEGLTKAVKWYMLNQHLRS